MGVKETAVPDGTSLDSFQAEIISLFRTRLGSTPERSGIDSRSNVGLVRFRDSPSKGVRRWTFDQERRSRSRLSSLQLRSLSQLQLYPMTPLLRLRPRPMRLRPTPLLRSAAVLPCIRSFARGATAAVAGGTHRKAGLSARPI